MKFIIIKFEESKKEEVVKTFPGKILRAGNGVLIAKLGSSNVPLKEGTYIIQVDGNDDIHLCAEECIERGLTQIIEMYE